MKNRLLYIVSLFPCWSETFIVRELHALQQAELRFQIASLKHHHEPLVHPFAEALLDRVIYPSPWVMVLWNALIMLARRPLSNLSWFLRLTAGLWRHPDHLLKSYSTVILALDFARRLAPNPPERIHAHWATYPSTAAMVMADNLDIPFSFTCHAHDIFLQDHLLKLKIKRADIPVTISDFNIAYLEKRLGGLPKKPEIVHCGVDLDEFAYQRGERRPNSIVAVGRLDEIKGFDYLIRASAELKAKGIDVTCDIIGDGEQRSTLERLILDLGLEREIRLLGVMPQDEVRQRIQEAEIFALHSIPDRNGNMDGIPVALMEAMALGTPAISTRVSGIPELIDHRKTGWMCEPRDVFGLALGLEVLLGDADLRDQLAAAARRCIEDDFDCRKEAGKLLQLFEAAA
ncbi:MAG: glycosyltransferase family 4 protein [Geminicoccaceae bacterium]